MELAGAFADDTETSVYELLSAGEPGVALELLCSQLVEHEIPISCRLKNRLVAAANIMCLEVGEIRDLRVDSSK
ncbi:hypothetical protein D3C71_1661910 [compost metagenome]